MNVSSEYRVLSIELKDNILIVVDIPRYPSVNVLLDPST
jgi:hypothetical protein